MLFFTSVFEFTKSEGNQTLTLIDTLYLSAQIVTTIGYGDLTPTTNGGTIVVAIYAVVGVVIVATLLQNCVVEMHEKATDKLVDDDVTWMGLQVGRYKMLLVGITTCTLCVGAGTLFFSLYEPEHKTAWEAFYMSIISVLTIGFGVYHPITQLGKGLGAIWMVVSVACIGQVIVSVGHFLFQEKRTYFAAQNACHIFRELDKDNSGTIDRHEFLHFELVRLGTPSHHVEAANDTFTKYDEDSSGTLDFDEFKKYVDVVLASG